MKRTLAALLVLIAAVGAVAMAAPSAAATPTTGTVVVQGNSGPAIVVPGGRDINLTRTSTASGSTRLNLTNGGELVADGATGGVLTLPNSENVTDGSVSVIGIQTNGGVLTLSPSTSQTVSIGKDITSLDWNSASSTTLDDGVVDFSYAGADGTTSLVEVGGVQSDTYVAAIDSNSGDILAVNKSTATGRVNFTQLPNSAHDVTLQTYDSDAPQASNPSPDSTSTNNENIQLSVDISDQDFTNPEDEVNVTFVLNGSELTTKTITSNQTVTTSANGLSDGSHSWHVEMEDSYGETSTSATYSFTVSHYDAVASDLKPTGKQNTRPSSISAQINDTDFAEPSGDSVTVTVSIDGSQVSQQTLSSNQTISTSIPESALTGGPHDYTVEMSDEYGRTSSSSAQYTIPYKLRIYNESAPDTLITSATAEIRFYGSDGTVATRSTSDGVLNLTGLPVAEEMVVSASADGYRSRTTYVETIYEKQRAYLLPENASAATIVYTLDDRTGEFKASETTILIQHPITRDRDGDGNDETKYETISGNRFSAAGEYIAELKTESRYRIIVENENDRQRMLGSYTATANDNVNLRIGQVSFSGTGADGYAVGITTFTADSNNDGSPEQYARVKFRDPGSKTSELNYEIRRPDLGKTIESVTVTDSLGTHVATFQVNGSATNTTYQLVWNATRDGENISGIRYAGDTPPIGDQLPIDPWWLMIIGLVGIVGIGGLVVGVDPALGAIAAVGAASLFTILGIVTIPMPALGLAGAIAVIALVGRA